MSASKRGSRSRISSPCAPVQSVESGESAAGKPKTMLQNWVAGAANSKITVGEAPAAPKSSWSEPAPAPARASYVEAGIIRHSIVSNMMPLGVGPPAKVLKALAKGESERSRSLVNSLVSTPDPAQETATPEEVSEDAPAESVDSVEPVGEEPVSSAEIAEPVASIEVAEVELPPQTSLPSNNSRNVGDGIEPISTTPQHSTSVQKSLSVSQPSVSPQSAAGQSVLALRSPIIGPQEERLEKPSRRYPRYLSETPEPPLGPDGLAVINLPFTDGVVEAAVQEALDCDDWPTAYALRLLWDEHRTDPDMVRMFDAVYNGWHNKEQMKKFQKVVRRKKREGKKGGRADEYFNGDGSESKPTPKSTIYNAINLVNPPAPVYQTPYIRKSREPSEAAPARSSSLAHSLSSTPANLSPAPPAMSVVASPKNRDEHVSKKQRSNSFQPASAELNGFAARSGADDVTMSEKGEERQKPEGGARPILENGVARDPKTLSRAQRSRSNSSSSSLSSVNEELILNSTIISPPRPVPPPGPMLPLAPHSLGMARFGVFAQLFQQPKQRVSPYASTTSFQEAALEADAQARNATRLTPAPAKGPKTFTFSTGKASPAPAPAPSVSASARPRSADSQASTVAPKEPADPQPIMAPVVVVNNPSSSTSSSKKPSKTTKKLPATFKIKNAKKSICPEEEDDVSNCMKRKAKEITGETSTAESFERHQVEVVAGDEMEWVSDGGDSTAVRAAKKLKKAPKVRLLHNSRETRQNSRYVSEEGSSPTELAFKPPFPPGGSGPSSRAGTPNPATRQSKKPKIGTGLRVKISPVKKNKGTLAGIPKDLRSPTGNGGTVAQDGENDEFCSACGGCGGLVCCDGCTRSFHSNCIDPPLSDDAVDKSPDWFCNACEYKKHGPYEEVGGIWGPLIADFADTNPRSFHLPQSIREYFVDVKTGPAGEYEEIIPPKPKNTKAGWEEAPDYYRKKDKNGKIILCHQCNGEASPPDRMIVPCTYCHLTWHLDCLPIPLAKEPGHGRQWRCPAHIDDLLVLIPEIMAPAHRFRKIKGAPVIKPAFPRGNKNSGHIEIENDPSEDEAVEGFYDVKEFGRVYKLPEKSIKLDFITRVKQTRGASLQSLRSPRSKPAKASHQPLQSAPGFEPAWNQRTIEEQQTALNLLSIHSQSHDAARGDDTQLLINTLLAEAPPAVISLMAQGTTDGLAARKLEKKQKTSITAMFEFLKQMLDDAVSTDEEEPPAKAKATVTVQDQETEMEL
ncbi:uncharacterized protein L3040_006756 [Drepanopeziza brunnea f. sp. 'multigermtubi']|uniref:PHD-finger domain-containing protein n=1 Tax=Marssonina brunnea f. sp. multigermtubi (strain MB_m1) TaxID=1072389 RepID=K1WKZ4_MARBU|nr:PHD-finger domain-containing protein [Drepanopeziza brunnea f. sp. 'multigermtubi' MB_m1]EKD18370.1 PHD-finger domain-containing protein [Drepanopeziza brunnea f. sp. 'multigermtubi' MB_m1]KAJ5039086.1 hypothetical protein L3040_006756 [Drepanopeziza brunnea f. sp. 'multigermtubi']